MWLFQKYLGLFIRCSWHNCAVALLLLFYLIPEWNLCYPMYDVWLLTVIACCRWVTFPVSFLYLVSVLRPRPQQLRPRRDVLLLRPLGHPGHAALPVVEEAHHTVTAGGFILFFLLSGIMSIQIRSNSSKNHTSYKNEVKLRNVPNLLRPDLVCIFSFSKVFGISRTWSK